MTDGELSINFTGITHDHSLLELNTTHSHNHSNNNNNDHHQRVPKGHEGADHAHEAQEEAESCSTIAILRRHPMYDSLVLVKRFRECLGGYALEFPADLRRHQGCPQEEGPTAESRSQQEPACGQRKLVSIFLDGDDPWFSNTMGTATQDENVGPMAQLLAGDPRAAAGAAAATSGEVVHVPINGLLDRLKGYTDAGVSVDSRVYAFAMGLKTAERIMASSSMRELSETPL